MELHKKDVLFCGVVRLAPFINNDNASVTEDTSASFEELALGSGRFSLTINLRTDSASAIFEKREKNGDVVNVNHLVKGNVIRELWE